MIFDYLTWRGDISFTQIPPTEVDLLILSQISYLNFDELISSSYKKTITLNNLLQDFIKTPDFEQRQNCGLIINKRTFELFTKCCQSWRFHNIQVCGYLNIFDFQNETQFAAIAFLIEKKVYIVFRGTDDSLIGWKEDFNLSVITIPAQTLALNYLEKAISFFKKKVNIIGHSKGGNLAIFSSTNCSAKFQKKIEKVYNFDGPGFCQDFYKTKNFLNIKERIFSFYPEFSVVGMIFSHPQNFKIVQSNGFTVFEHDLMTWNIKGSIFEYSANFTKESIFFHKTFNEWIFSLNLEQRTKFINSLFELLFASETQTLEDFSKNAFSSSAKMIKKFNSFDKQTKTDIRKIISLLKEVISSEIPILKSLSKVI